MIRAIVLSAVATTVAVTFELIPEKVSFVGAVLSAAGLGSIWSRGGEISRARRERSMPRT